MNFILQAVCCNGCACVLLITMLLNHRRKHGTKTEAGRLFILMIFSNLLQCIVESVTVLIDGRMFPGAVALATGTNAFLFMNNIVFAYLWSLYARAKIFPHRKKIQLRDYLRAVPALLIILGAVTNLFAPVFFRITDQNVYERVGIYFLSFVVTYFYLALGTFTVFTNRNQKEKAEFLPAFTFLFPVCVASVIQLLVPGISLLWSGSAIGLASAYMNLQDESAFTDKLSGLFSRHYLNLYLSSMQERTREGQLLLGMMMDVDDFKSINDSYGHLAGDEAIRAVGEILRTAIPHNRSLFRYAGDEFVAIMPIQDISEADALAKRVWEETERFNAVSGKPYRLRLSIGCTAYVPGENPNSFIDRMDARMYQNKRLHKELPTD